MATHPPDNQNPPLMYPANVTDGHVTVYDPAGPADENGYYTAYITVNRGALEPIQQ
jgi:hypothetical protein